MSRQMSSLSAAHCRLFPAAVFALTLFACLLVPCALAQAPEPLSVFRNYFVTGDYVVGGVGLQGLGVNGFATGMINIPDQVQPNAQSIPAGADVVAAFLYWQTVESAKYPLAGQNGWFNGFPIAGTQLPSASQAPVSWSTGGCSGGANGSKYLNTYRADVRPYLNFDALGRVAGNGSYVVKLRDSGSNGGGVPLTLGATLVIIYRVLSPTVPLKSIVLYDGDFAPVNQGSTMTQDILGFYDVADSPISEITQIVGNGQPNKYEAATLNGANLVSLYGSLPPFPGKYNGSWDNPTWAAPANAVPPGGITGNTNPVTTSVVPNSSNSGCVVWGAIIFGTTVRDSDNDGLLDSWETNQGYTDVLTNRYVPLPGADPNTKDVFVDLDYLTNLGASAMSGTYAHSHLPKQQAIDDVGAAFAGAPIDMDPATGKYKGVRVHFDLGSDANGHPIYPGDAYVVPDNASKAIPESTLLCQNSATLCEFPNQVAVGWKTGLLYVEDAAVSPGTSTTPPVGYFDPARKDSYHYVLFGHALGLPLSWWTTFGATTNNPTVAQLTSISVLNNSAKITLQTPASCAGAMPSPCYVYPGAQPTPGSPGYGDTNLDRITIADAINSPALNGTYIYSNPNSSTSNYVTTTSFTITTSGVPDGTYTFANEPRLAVLYAGPSSSSGHSDIGGADSLITFGLWPADDNPGCQPDPAAVPAGQNNYCDNEVGNVQAQAGTLMHELGHSFTLTHGGTYALQNYPATPLTYGVNCKPNYQSVMNYLFQVRGFPEGSPIDYSRQSLQNLYEDTLSESTGIGADSSGKLALHATRWFAPPNSFDLKLGNRTATVNCDGSPLFYGEAGEVRVDNGPGYAGMIAAGTSVTNASPIDWNNDLTTPDLVTSSIDVNLDGVLESASSSPNPPSPMVGFSDWQNIDFRQIGARAGGAGYSGGVGLTGGGGVGLTGGGGVGLTGGGGTPSDLAGGNGVGLTGGGGVGVTGGGGVGVTGGGGVGVTGGGGEVDFDLANSTVDPAVGVTAVMGNKAVVLHWNPPAFGQIRSYLVYRLAGLFDPNKSDKSYNPLTNAQLIATVKGAPPLTTYTDSTVKNKTTYTYFVVAALGDGQQSAVSNGAVITVSF